MCCRCVLSLLVVVCCAFVVFVLFCVLLFVGCLSCAVCSSLLSVVRRLLFPVVCPCVLCSVRCGLLLVFVVDAAVVR